METKEMRNQYIILIGKLEGRHDFGYIGVNGKIPAWI
jgi:hypothetical protein